MAGSTSQHTKEKIKNVRNAKTVVYIYIYKGSMFSYGSGSHLFSLDFPSPAKHLAASRLAGHAFHGEVHVEAFGQTDAIRVLRGTGVHRIRALERLERGMNGIIWYSK